MTIWKEFGKNNGVHETNHGMAKMPSAHQSIAEDHFVASLLVWPFSCGGTAILFVDWLRSS
jgi:hypothetical protein